MANIYQHKPLKERQGASLALTTSDPVKIDGPGGPKRNVACRSEDTVCGSRESVSADTAFIQHATASAVRRNPTSSGDTARDEENTASIERRVFVISCDGKPLTPTKPARARKLLRDGLAKKVWSKLGTFGIQLLGPVREETPETVLGVDNGTKFEGYSVVCGTENLVNVKWNLPAKRNIVNKMTERRQARRTRRGRLRRRQARFQNRARNSRWLAPSQNVVHLSRIKIMRELCRIYPVGQAAVEDVRFNHKKHRWGSNFSTIEVSKQNIRDWFAARQIEVTEFDGKQTGELREKFGFKKTCDKAANVFTSHCSDSLALACEIAGQGVEVKPFMVFDDTYRCVRRKLHKSNLSKGGIRKNRSTGIVRGLRKGLIVGVGEDVGILVGLRGYGYRYRDIGLDSTRKQGSELKWVSSQFTEVFAGRRGSWKRCGDIKN